MNTQIQQLTPKLIYADIYQRFFASLIVGFAFFVLVFIISLFKSDYYDYGFSLIPFITTMSLNFAYYLLDCDTGTLGKVANKIKVIDDKTGKSITVSKTLLRTLCKLIPFNNIISLFTISNREDKKAMHDIIMKTSVVRKS